MFNQLKAAASSFQGSNNNNNNNVQQTQQQSSNQAQAGTTNGNTAQASSGGDALDKGIDFLSKKLGMKSSHAQTEKYSDMARDQYKKMTGKDIPIADKEYK